jgi:flagellar biosynthetic protein FliQ
MTQEIVIELIQSAVMTVITVAAPPLIMGLTVGVSVSIFQAVTSIQEPTMAFVPKIIAVMFSIVFFGYFMLGTIIDYVTALYSAIPTVLEGLRSQ